MPQDLFELNGINPAQNSSPRDLFQEAGIAPNDSISNTLGGKLLRPLAESVARHPLLDKVVSKLAAYDTPAINAASGYLQSSLGSAIESNPLSGSLKFFPQAKQKYSQFINDIEQKSKSITPLANKDSGAYLAGELAPVAQGLAGLGSAGFSLAKNAFSNEKLIPKLVSYLEKQHAKSGALSPQDTTLNIAQNFTTPEGKMMDVDIGTAANNKLLKGLYKGLNVVPFSGAAQKTNLLKDQLANKSIFNIENELAKAHQSPDLANQANYLMQLKNQEGAEKSNIDSIKNSAHNLLSSIDNPQKTNDAIANDIKRAFSKEKKIANENYEPINKSNIRLETTGYVEPFKNYKSAALDLLAQRENLKNLFGTDSELGSRLNKEIDIAQKFIDGNQDKGATLNELVDRTRNLGRLQSAANGAGNRNEGRLLGNLRDGLLSDIHGNLNKIGRDDLSNVLLNANEHYKKDYLPFFSDKTIRDSHLNNNVPVGDALGKALHNPNNAAVLNKLNPAAKDAAAFQMLAKGRGKSSSGNPIISANKLSLNYSSLADEFRTQLASHKPELDSSLQTLADSIAKHKELQKIGTKLGSQLISNAKERFSEINSLQDALKKQRNLKFGTQKEGGAQEGLLKSATKLGVAGLLAKALGGAAAIAPVLGKKATNLLTDKKLIEAYMQSQRGDK